MAVLGTDSNDYATFDGCHIFIESVKQRFWYLQQILGNKWKLSVCQRRIWAYIYICIYKYLCIYINIYIYIYIYSYELMLPIYNIDYTTVLWIENLTVISMFVCLWRKRKCCRDKQQSVQKWRPDRKYTRQDCPQNRSTYSTSPYSGKSLWYLPLAFFIGIAER